MRPIFGGAKVAAFADSEHEQINFFPTLFKIVQPLKNEKAKSLFFNWAWDTSLATHPPFPRFLTQLSSGPIKLGSTNFTASKFVRPIDYDSDSDNNDDDVNNDDDNNNDSKDNNNNDNNNDNSDNGDDNNSDDDNNNDNNDEDNNNDDEDYNEDVHDRDRNDHGFNSEDDNDDNDVDDGDDDDTADQFRRCKKGRIFRNEK